MRCAAQLRPTVAWRRINSNALRTLPKSHSSSGVLFRFKDQMHSCLHVLTYMKADLNLLAKLQDPASSTFTYFLADSLTKEAVIIDPVLEQAERDASFVQNAGLQLIYAVNTHCHADHITGTGALKKLFPSVKSVISQDSKCTSDMHVVPGDKLIFGESSLEVLATPGHTSGCVTYYSPQDDGVAFTGDALLIQGCGRTDFQEGNARQLYKSVHTQLFSLPDSTIVYPAHDYKGRASSTIASEKTSNPRLGLSEDKFVELMQNLGLPYPKKIDVAVPANLACGVY